MLIYYNLTVNSLGCVNMVMVSMANEILCRYDVALMYK